MKYTKSALAQLFILCRARPGYKTLAAFGSKERARGAMLLARDMLENGESINLMTGDVSFPNGSKIVVDYPECVRADSFHVISVDELVDERMVEHLKTRERL